MYQAVRASFHPAVNLSIVSALTEAASGNLPEDRKRMRRDQKRSVCGKGNWDLGGWGKLDSMWASL